jgi:hypothetical protein
MRKRKRPHNAPPFENAGGGETLPRFPLRTEDKVQCERKD